MEINLFDLTIKPLLETARKTEFDPIPPGIAITRDQMNTILGKIATFPAMPVFPGIDATSFRYGWEASRIMALIAVARHCPGGIKLICDEMLDQALDKKKNAGETDVRH